ncbi:MAG: GerW family sporulation protein, partial [Alistipes sp.]|nr:GerW family sporulation protein [Alistipes sp.]
GGSGFGKTPGADNFGGGSGGSVKITPVAFLIVNGDNVRLVSRRSPSRPSTSASTSRYSWSRSATTRSPTAA